MNTGTLRTADKAIRLAIARALVEKLADGGEGVIVATGGTAAGQGVEEPSRGIGRRIRYNASKDGVGVGAHGAAAGGAGHA